MESSSPLPLQGLCSSFPEWLPDEVMPLGPRGGGRREMLLAGPQFAWKMAARGLRPRRRRADRGPRGERMWGGMLGGLARAGPGAFIPLPASMPAAPGPHTEPRLGLGPLQRPWELGLARREWTLTGPRGGRRALAGMRALTRQAACSWSEFFPPRGRASRPPSGAGDGPVRRPAGAHPCAPPATSLLRLFLLKLGPFLQNGNCPQRVGEAWQLSAEGSPEVTPSPPTEATQEPADAAAPGASRREEWTLRSEAAPQKLARQGSQAPRVLPGSGAGREVTSAEWGPAGGLAGPALGGLGTLGVCRAREQASGVCSRGSVSASNGLCDGQALLPSADRRLRPPPGLTTRDQASQLCGGSLSLGFSLNICVGTDPAATERCPCTEGRVRELAAGPGSEPSLLCWP